MHLKTILNLTENHPLFVYDSFRLVKGKPRHRLEIKIRPRKGSSPVCSGCKQPGGGYDTLAERRFEHVPLWGIAVVLLYCMRRVQCPQCGIKVESVPWASGKCPLTKSFMHVLSHWARKLSWVEVARSFFTSWEQVFHSVDYIVQWGLKHRRLDGITAIGIDEIQWHRGHKYLTLVYQINSDCVRLLWIGKDRTAKSLLRFFRMLGKPLSSKIQFVCSDMWKAYLKVVKKKVPQAIHILDRFHIVAKLNKAIDEVRAGEHRKMQQDGYEPLLKNSKWALLKRKKNMTGKQQIKLKTLLQYNLKSVRAYLLKEDFQCLWDYVSPIWAGKFLDCWCTKVMRSRLEPLKKIAKTLRKHRTLILNWFIAKKQFSSGIVEGLNNKVKLTIRKSYGFRSFRCTELALYHSLGKLPEPPITHRFY